MTEDVPRIDVTIAASADDVWRALRDPVLISRWHGWNYDGLDEEIRVIFVDGATADPERRQVTMRAGDLFSLHPVPEGVLVRVTRAPRGTNPEWEAYYDDITEGWKTFLQQLRFGLERHGLAERRTAVLTGGMRGSLFDAFGFADVTEAPVGARYQATAAPGDALSGEVFARTEHQLTLTVDELGPGLLVLGQGGPTEARPNGMAMVLLSAYGTGEEEFASLEKRWTAWWESVRIPEETPATT